MTHENETHSESEIQEDIVSVPLIAWLGGVSTILVIITVIVLMGVFYMTTANLEVERQVDADARVTEIEAQRAIDAMIVDGYYEHPGLDDGQGNVTRGTVSIPVAVGMQKVIEDAQR